MQDGRRISQLLKSIWALKCAMMHILLAKIHLLDSAHFSHLLDACL